MENDVLLTIKRRRSTRAFLPRQIQDEQLAAIVDAGQYAPNGGGEAWHFTVVQNADILERMNTLAKQYAATSGMPWLVDLGNNAQFHSVYHAPTVILVSGDAQSVCAESDTAAATQTLLLAAESLGVGACWGYFVTQAFLAPEGVALRNTLQIPDGYTVHTSVMLGYRDGDMPAPPARKPGCVTYIK